MLQECIIIFAYRPNSYRCGRDSSEVHCTRDDDWFNKTVCEIVILLPYGTGNVPMKNVLFRCYQCNDLCGKYPDQAIYTVSSNR